MTIRPEVDSRWLLPVAAVVLGIGVMLGVMLSGGNSMPPPTQSSTSPESDPALVDQMRRLADLAERLYQTPPPVVREAAPSTSASNSEQGSVRELCNAVYALIESGQHRGGAPSYGEVVAIPATNHHAVEAALTSIRDVEARRNKRCGELLMESRASLLRRLGKPSEVEMSQTGAPIWRYDTDTEILEIDFSVGGYVIGMRRSTKRQGR